MARGGLGLQVASGASASRCRKTAYYDKGHTLKLSEIPPHITEAPGAPEPFWNAYKAAYGESVEEDDIIPLWHLDYYDGPLSGVVGCKGRYFYVRHCYYLDRHWWVAWALTEDEWARARANHDAFEEHVGDHTSYRLDDEGVWKACSGNVKPDTHWDKFYKNPNIPKVDYRAEVETRDMFAILRNPFRSWW